MDFALTTFDNNRKHLLANNLASVKKKKKNGKMVNVKVL